MKLVAGSYERFLWGWKPKKEKKGKKKEKEKEKEKEREREEEEDGEGKEEREKEKESELDLLFSYPAHVGPIKCVATYGQVLATGSTDDTIKLFDLGAGQDMGTLTQHTGAVTCLDFFGPHTRETIASYPSHLLSGSHDGTVCIWDADTWQHFKTMKGHKHGVNDLTIHPSGRIAVSVGCDSQLNMYNLLKGRCAFSTKLSSEGSLIRFSLNDGDSYFLSRGNEVSMNNSEDGCSLMTFAHDKRVLCMAQQEEGLLFTGGEESTIRAWDVSSGALAFSIPNAHTPRVKGLAVMGHSSSDGGGVGALLASASSDGFVRVWDSRMIRVSQGDAHPIPIMQANSNSRLTCLVACLSRKSEVREKKLEVREKKPMDSGEADLVPTLAELKLPSGAPPRQDKKEKSNKKKPSNVPPRHDQKEKKKSKKRARDNASKASHRVKRHK